MLYWRRPHMDDAPPDSIYVSDSYEDPYLTMVPATYAEVVAWVEERRVSDAIVDKTEDLVRHIQNLPEPPNHAADPGIACERCAWLSDQRHPLSSQPRQLP